MRSIVYAGNDFSEICSAEVIERAANPIIAEAMAVPGRAGALLVSGYIPPVDVRVRLFMDMGYNPGFTGVAQMRGKVRRWLSWPGGGSLVLPDDPEVEYRDAMLVGASDWSNLFEAGECTLTFTLFDPIGWGAERVERTSRFEVGGDWPTLPEFRVVASAGSYLQVSLPSAGKGIRVDYDFAGMRRPRTSTARARRCSSTTLTRATAWPWRATSSRWSRETASSRPPTAPTWRRASPRGGPSMAGSVPTLYWFDRWDERIGLLRVVGELVHTEELNGEDTLEFCSYEVPTKGDRLPWLDGSTWREHVVVRTDEPVAGLCSVYAESSLCELLDDFIEEAQLVSRTAAQALAAVLAPTRWSVAYCASLSTAGTLIYHQNALWALRRVAEVWGGEVTPVITVSNGRVASRSIRLDDRRGDWRGLRFTYGKNMAGCTRTVLEQDVYTALYGFGAGLPFTDEDGNYKAGYRRKLTFGDINGGLNYVADEDAKLVWGRWNAGRTARVHSFGQVTFSEVTEPERLLALTRRALVEASQPKASYEVDVAALDGDDADSGDTVAVVDTSRDPEWRLTARVVRRVRTFGERVVARVTIGTVEPVDYAQVSALAADVATLRDDVVGIDGNLTTAASVTVVENTVTTAIDDLDELADLDF